MYNKLNKTMLKLLKKLRELVFGKTAPVVIEAPKVIENKVVETNAPKKKSQHKSKPKTS